MQVPTGSFFSKVFHNSSPNQPNKALAKEMIKSSKKYKKEVKQICQNDSFYQDPIAHLINEMISRGVGRCRSDDFARAEVMEKIPGLVEKATSSEYLKEFAITHYKDHPKKAEILKIFEESLETDQFKKDLQAARDSYKRYQEKKENFSEVERVLGIPLTIFKQAKGLNTYEHPEESCEEKCMAG